MEDYEVVSFAKSPSVKSVPLFLPSNLKYDARSNTVTEIEPSSGDDGTSHPLVLVPDAGAKILESVKNSPISCISCVGPYRTGKSLLMSRFLKDSEAFEVGPTLEGCTRGIWISTSAMKDGSNDCHTFLLDCEGAGDPLENDEASNIRIALICILISNVFMFNNTGRPDRTSLQFLSYLITIRKRMPTSETDETPNFPSFLWVFRDFFLQLPVRKDTKEPYTLQEYMLERVLTTTTSNNTDDSIIIDSLLNDFKSMNVMSVSYPKRQLNDEAFDSNEMSKLDTIPWNEIHEDFRNDVQAVIDQAYGKAHEPFMLNSVPTNGKVFVQWCQQVLEIVNSDQTIPNLPDLQQQLLQSILKEEIQKSMTLYQEQIQKYLDDECLVYNNGKTVDDDNTNKGVANVDELQAKSDSIVQDLIASIQTITKESDDMMKDFQTKCNEYLHTIIFVENEKRSKSTCMALARSLYTEIRENMRMNATNISQDEFSNSIGTMLTEYRSHARGPCVEEIVETFVKEQEESDMAFLEKVHGIHSLYQETLQEKEKLNATVQETKQQVEALEITMKETKDEHDRHVEELAQKSKEDMKQLTEDHMKSMESAIAEQQSIQETKLDELAKNMNAQLDALQEERKADLKEKEVQLENLRQDAERKLADEISAREDRMKKTEESHEQQIQKLLKVADERMKAEIMSAEEKRKNEITSFNEQMNQKLHEAEERMRKEIEEREKKLQEAKEQHQRELEKERLALMKTHEEERDRYLKEIDELNNRCLNPNCAIM